MRTRLLSLLAGLALVFGIVPSTAHASTSVPVAAVVDLANLELGDEQGYNAVGPDRAWNRNAEWVDVRNTSDSPVDVKGLILEDSWRHGQPDSYAGKCNRYTVDSVPQADGSATNMLPGKHTLRVYVGDGDPKVFNSTFHGVYMNSLTSCGYFGHVFNNSQRKGDRFAPWDTAYISLGGQTKSKSYRFPFGFTAPTG
jgi:hypothetical protein